MSERSEQIHVFDVLRLNEAQYPYLKWVYASMNGLHSPSARMAADRKRQGQRAGVSDICLPFPSKMRDLDYQYHGAYIEMKNGKRGKVTADQEEFLDFLASHGYAAFVARSADAALDCVQNYCGIKLRGRK